MERDPLRFVRASTPGLHLVALALLLVALPLAYAGIDLVRVALDHAVAGRAFGAGGLAPFGRIALDLPSFLAAGPVVLHPGVALDRSGFALATLGAFAALVVVGALVAWWLARLRARIGARALARLRETLLAAIAEARPSARDEARAAASLAGEALARENGFLGSAVIQPVLAGGAIGLAVFYALQVDFLLVAAIALPLLAALLAWPRRGLALARIQEARVTEGAAARRGLLDLVRRLPALRAHGTADFERERIAAELAQRNRPVRAAERRSAREGAGAVAATLLLPTSVLAAGAWLGLAGRVTAGEVAATLAGGAAAAAALLGLMTWRRSLETARPLFEEIARALGALQTRAPARTDGARAEGQALPGAGALVAEAAAAYDAASGTRLAPVDLSLAFPAHVALTGEVGSGAKVFAAMIGGALDPSMGRLGFGGVDLAAVPPGERARRIAYAGGDTVLIAGTLRQNLLYGCLEAGAEDIDHRLASAAAVAGLDGFVHGRGLSGTIDPVKEVRLAQDLVDARRRVQACLVAEGLTDLVEPFDPERYNAQATIAENILFGVPVGDTFRETNLPAHPFMRAILEAQELQRPLQAMGLQIATSMVEIFADIPDGHPLFDRFSFFSASERGYFEDLVARQSERRRGAEPARDRERLVSLALRYIESRHRLGLLTPEIEARLLAARGAFAKLLPTSLQPAIEFYDPARLCAAASIQDNLLFGRIAADRAGAEAGARQILREVLTERGLDGDVLRIGFDTRIDARGDGLLAVEVAAVDLVRCLVRRPDMLVVEHAAEGLPTDAAEALVQRLRRALIGRGLVLALPEVTSRMDMPPFDAVLRFERGGLASVDARRPPGPRAAPAEPQPLAAVGS